MPTYVLFTVIYDDVLTRGFLSCISKLMGVSEQKIDVFVAVEKRLTYMVSSSIWNENGIMNVQPLLVGLTSRVTVVCFNQQSQLLTGSIGGRKPVLRLLCVVCHHTFQGDRTSGCAY